MNIGRALKEIRKEKGLSQRQLSEGTGISQTAISQFESGKRDPHKTTVNTILTFLNVPVAYVVLLSIDDVDVNQEKKEAYKTIYPAVKDLIMEMIK